MGRHGTIAGRKAAQDSKRAAMFTKYARAIIVAAKAGGCLLYTSKIIKNEETGGNMKNTQFYICPQCGNIITCLLYTSSGIAER